MAKQFSILFICLLFTQANYGQWRYGKLLADSSIHSITSISNTLYVGIDNDLSLNLAIPDAVDTLLLRTNNGRIIYNNGYVVIPNRAGKLRVEVHTQTDGRIDTVGFYRFKVLPLPFPKVAFDTTIIEENMLISKEAFINADSLYITITNDIPDSRNWVVINEFSIGYNYGGYFIEKSSRSNAITDEMRDLVAIEGAGRTFSIKVITQSATSLLLTHPMYRVMFY